MPRIVVASAISRWVNRPEGLTIEGSGSTVRDLLDELFSQFPNLRGYILDETAAIRHHVVAFVAGIPIADKNVLDDHVPNDGELYIFQALSGG